MDLETFLNYHLFTIGNYSLSVYSLVAVAIIWVLTYLLTKLIKKALFSAQKHQKIETGSAYALYNLIKYILWVIAIALALNAAGIELTVWLAGSAALLVGVGLGLQQTFNDFISGIILLFEGSIKVGDILDIDGDVVKIQNIGLRTSTAINRDDIIAILPNSLITTNKVVNWSHQTEKTRFRINVGVAYGSDVDLVIELLKQSAAEHSGIKNKAAINARFIDFGNSSLDFELLFFSRDIFRIENVKSEIRKIINQKFNENNVRIPFPQMDLHLRTDYTNRDTKTK